MTTYITKPEFNLDRELAALRYGKLPYEKAAPGSLIQIKYLKRANDASTSSSTYSNIDTIIFSPKLPNSIIELEMDYSTGGTTSTAMQFRMINVTRDSAVVGVSGYHNIVDYADAAQARFNMKAYDTPNSCAPQTYTIQGRNTQNSGTIWFHTYGGSAFSWFVIREYAQ